MSEVATKRDERRTPFVICHAVPFSHMVAIVAVSVVVVVLSSIVAWDGTVPDWEVSILEFINGWPDWLKPPMWALQQVGVLFAPVVAGLLIYYSTRKWQHLVPFVLVLPLKLGIEKGLVKQFVERERPAVSVGDSINVRGPGIEGLAFPSGHTTTAFALGILLSAFLPPRWRPVPIIWAVIVGIARMYYGEHNVLDVVAGAALGTAFAVALWYFFLNRHVHPDCSCAA
jgi:membrane-associated phospholipid phosphatase